MNQKQWFYILLPLLSMWISQQAMANPLNKESYVKSEHQFLYSTEQGEVLRLQFYTDQVIRIQAVRPGEDFFADTHYEMVASHTRTGTFHVSENDSSFQITTGNQDDGLLILVNKSPLRLTFISRKTDQTLLRDAKGIEWNGNKITTSFRYDPREHFCGMGHQSFGLVESLDLAGQKVSCNYGEGKVGDWGYQAVLTVPFYLSGKGYGVFLNSTYHHQFDFGQDNKYQFEIDTKGFEGRMDYFFIFGPGFRKIINRYTKLTGRPRLPQRSIFGLQLSDKGAPDNNGAEWWEKKITAHRQAGFPFDHVVNDNRWRAGSGAWSGSWFAWDSTRYPHPKAYAEWCQENHVTVTLDLNRNNAASCWGWKKEYNIPQAEKYVKEGYSTPDYSNPATRNWIWSLFWNKSFNPALHYPGDALWIDEIDELGNLNDSIICANGRSWAENENYYPFLIAKAIVQEGWDNENHNEPPGIGEAKRPYVWMRGMCAGAQRYATYWTGDLKCSYAWMKKNIRAMQVAGLCGFPYFNHDAGGYRAPGPDDPMYIQWSMAFGSFTPIWRPHGIGKYKRWPLDRSQVCQDAALRYGKIRYELMPYIYSNAHIAQETGIPMARAMVIDYSNYPQAWQYDLQYMWGDEMLVAPSCASKDTTLSVWLPPGQNWYNYWNDSLYQGNETLRYQARVGYLPVFIKEGAIIPRYHYALSTFTLNPKKLILDVYPGKDGSFTLYEDDGVTEKFRTKGELRTTRIIYQNQSNTLTINPSRGDYSGAPSQRSYEIIFHGIKNPGTVKVNGKILAGPAPLPNDGKKTAFIVMNEKNNTLHVITNTYSVHKSVAISMNK